jgi:glutathione S-transferase
MGVESSSAKPLLVIGNKAFSSWSLRPWLALRMAGVEFEEIVIPLRQPDTKARILAHSPSGKVPALQRGDWVIWDSLAICEYAAEQNPSARLWPEDPAVRAVARSVASEMHAGFPALRQQMSMNLKERFPGKGRTPESLADIARITQLWREIRARYGTAGGPFLFGHFTIADALYAPVCTRFDTYAVELDETCQAYVDAVRALPPLVEWTAAARAEPWTLDL